MDEKEAAPQEPESFAEDLLRRLPEAPEEPPEALLGRILRRVRSWTLLRDCVELATAGFVRVLGDPLLRRRGTDVAPEAAGRGEGEAPRGGDPSRERDAPRA